MRIVVRNGKTLVKLDKRERDQISKAVNILASLAQHDLSNENRLIEAVDAIGEAMEAYDEPVESPAV